MNFIAGIFLYHAEEYIAFSLLTLLMVKLNLRDILKEGIIFSELNKIIKDFPVYINILIC